MFKTLSFHTFFLSKDEPLGRFLDRFHPGDLYLVKKLMTGASDLS